MTVVWLGQGKETTYAPSNINNLVVDAKGFCTAGSQKGDATSDLRGSTVTAATQSDGKTTWNGKADLTKFCTDAKLSGCKSITMRWRKVKQM